jgi:hypothetical protein
VNPGGIMNRVGNILAVPFIISLTIVIACSDKGTEPESHASTFPHAAGTRWRYYTIIDLHYMVDTTHIDSDTMILDISVEGPDTILDLQDAYTTIAYGGQLGLDGVSATRNWYRYDGTLLNQYVSQRVMPYVDEPVYYDPPLVRLDFPLTPGKSWVYDRVWSNYYADSVICTKTVTGSDNIVALGNTYKCDIVKNRWVKQSNDSLTYEIDEYYSNEGLIYEKKPDRISYLHNEHGDIIDSALVSYHTELVVIDIR